MSETRISREDLEAKFRQVQSDLQGALDDRKQGLVLVAGVGGLLALVVVYLLGRRAGRRRAGVVEIRRV